MNELHVFSSFFYSTLVHPKTGYRHQQMANVDIFSKRFVFFLWIIGRWQWRIFVVKPWYTSTRSRGLVNIKNQRTRWKSCFAQSVPLFEGWAFTSKKYQYTWRWMDSHFHSPSDSSTYQLFWLWSISMHVVNVLKEYAVSDSKKNSSDMKKCAVSIWPIRHGTYSIRTQMKLDLLTRCIFPHSELLVPAGEVTTLLLRVVMFRRFKHRF